MKICFNNHKHTFMHVVIGRGGDWLAIRQIRRNEMIYGLLFSYPFHRKCYVCNFHEYVYEIWCLICNIYRSYMLCFCRLRVRVTVRTDSSEKKTTGVLHDAMSLTERVHKHFISRRVAIYTVF